MKTIMILGLVGMVISLSYAAFYPSPEYPKYNNPYEYSDKGYGEYREAHDASVLEYKTLIEKVRKYTNGAFVLLGVSLISVLLSLVVLEKREFEDRPADYYTITIANGESYNTKYYSGNGSWGKTIEFVDSETLAKMEVSKDGIVIVRNHNKMKDLIKTIKGTSVILGAIALIVFLLITLFLPTIWGSPFAWAGPVMWVLLLGWGLGDEMDKKNGL